MELSTILFIALAAVFALGFAFFQYLFRSKRRTRNVYIFFTLRFLSVFVLLILLINPEISSTTYELKKSNLVLAVDDSESIAHLKQEDTVQIVIQRIKQNEDIQERFNVQQVSFGEKLSSGSDLEFNEPQTDISVALNQVNKLYRRENTAVILISDGNQNIGRDYQYFKAHDNINLFPVVVGDTTQYADLQLSNLNVNRYAFLNNRFPVEAIINYTGEENISANFVIRSGENVIYSEEVKLNEDQNSAIIGTTLPASQLGVLTYEAEIIPLDNEKNRINNVEKFAVEIIDERTNVLILSAIAHPDLGALKKAIESNEQREATIQYIDSENLELKDFQLIILYQPNNTFNSVIEEIQQENINYFLVTGTKTDWNFVNGIQEQFKKDASFQEQDIFPLVNNNFNKFQFEDIGFDNFPPLQDQFGGIEVLDNSFSTLLYQQIEGIETEQPLLAISDENSSKQGVLFGENIWKWRSQSYLKNGNFRQFDDFFGKIIQNLSSKKSRDRLTVDYESFYYGNTGVIISAQYFDENYQFDPRAKITIQLTHKESEETIEAPLLLRNNQYEVDLGNLEEGEYNFKVQPENSTISENGSFTIIDFNVEQQFISADFEKLQLLAGNNDSGVYFSDTTEILISDLLQDKRYLPVQKSREKTVPLIDWYFLLFLLVLLLTAEWFYRKYNGLI
ncbi:VWA domain-containing protein [Salegentibacter sp. F188]|uniref:VWA domain-containing protein n=1 Tax=Autumnicola patrickiae TaxID=3075591 RepID=A0ABU3E5M9_9FLAO|nr:VWA domain-containing protein [Salegentibacter sp. F188]MDT0690507.1 VWA domain-containing protein [Salegentibacter sp. F188]